MKEEWKDVAGYEGMYQVSNLGRFFGVRTNRILKSYLHRNGYMYQSLSKNGRVKHYLVHRLVALAFIPNPTNLPEINHKDLNKKNNSVENLEWCSHRMNMEHSLINGQKRGATGENHPYHKLSEADVKEIRRKLKQGISGNHLAKEYGINCKAIYDIRDYETWKDVK